ncbi:hypothetical protein CLPU_22c00140 [Gottschalkia purinilytica]|uniref:Uncharacterized protein n=1 Tax=Gottschalkia purinilytica TaxID=1503 RepID=A0A0L0W6Q1_GOTPU|nr:hypothetical protein [Gottschalkia purinilytica]KNF07162.1 hypothetical protein CLPU_22c00140 [Gottschalkia purinilytica]
MSKKVKIGLYFFLGLIAFGSILKLFGYEPERPKKEEVKQVVNQKKKQKKKEDSIPVSFNVAELKEENVEEVNKVLGEPISNEKARWKYYGTEEYIEDGCFENVYKKDEFEVEVFFIENKAARIAITPQEKMDIKKDSKKFLKRLGLPTGSIYSETSLVRAWEYLGGLYTVTIGTVNQESDEINYMYIIVDEKYR